MNARPVGNDDSFGERTVETMAAILWSGERQSNESFMLGFVHLLAQTSSSFLLNPSLHVQEALLPTTMHFSCTEHFFCKQGFPTCSNELLLGKITPEENYLQTHDLSILSYPSLQVHSYSPPASVHISVAGHFNFSHGCSIAKVPLHTF